MYDLMLSNILFMRHGQAALYADQDHQRSLTEEGRKEVRKTGEGLVEILSEIKPSHLLILVSDARRTQQTWGELKMMMDDVDIAQHSVMVLSTLYLASSDRIYNVILEALTCDESKTTLLLIGHNPGCSNFVNHLVGAHLSLQTAQLVHLAQREDSRRWMLCSQVLPR